MWDGSRGGGGGGGERSKSGDAVEREMGGGGMLGAEMRAGERASRGRRAAWDGLGLRAGIGLAVRDAGAERG